MKPASQPRRCATCGHFLPASEHARECADCRRAKTRPGRGKSLLSKMEKGKAKQ